MRGGPPNEVGSTSAGGYREIRWGSANQVGPPMKVKSSQVNAALELPGAPALRAKRPRRVRRNGQAKVEAGVSGTRATRGEQTTGQHCAHTSPALELLAGETPVLQVKRGRGERTERMVAAGG